MSGEDLDSFFAEINEISAAEEAPSNGVARNDEIGPMIATAPVISKPAELSSRNVVSAQHTVAASHPVYTYNQSELFTNNQMQPEVQYHHQSTVHDSRPPPPAIAPPKVPRQNKVSKFMNRTIHILLNFYDKLSSFLSGFRPQSSR